MKMAELRVIPSETAGERRRIVFVHELYCNGPPLNTGFTFDISISQNNAERKERQNQTARKLVEDISRLKD
jgi:hypothetical protein